MLPWSQLAMPDVIVAGHICLDIIPTIPGRLDLEPGKLVEVGAAAISTGGAVSNTGRALHRLGVDVRLMGKVGDDLFGRAILASIGELSEGMVLAADEPSSYTVVLNVPGQDRIFLHAPGCNATFRSLDVPSEALAAAKWLHFGYPPLMRTMYAEGGRELVDLFRRAKELGLTTSLDMSLPDPDSESGRVDWEALLVAVLPYVDFFLPSDDELRLMLKMPEASVPPLMAKRALEMGAKVCGVKCGQKGFYLASSSALTNLGRGISSPEAWSGLDILTFVYPVQVVGTTGAGDALIAGFIRSAVNGEPPEQARAQAVVVGAMCCEQADSLSGIPTVEELHARLQHA
jgi:sugar/nucleoside kinase (ribokinase family)